MKRLALGAIMAASFTMPATAGVELVKNGSFEDNHVGANARVAIDAAGLADWQALPDATGHNYLTYLVTPGMADHPAYTNSVYGPFPATSPDGGDFIQGDGDPYYSRGFFQTIEGLTIGASYELSFWQAAGQQHGLTGPTTEWWEVGFGDDVQTTSVYSLPQAGIGPWEKETMTFIASATSQTLTFLAKGTPGGAPPMSFLDGVSLQAAAVPEPGTWAMMLGGFGLIGFAARRRPTRAMA